MMFNMFTTTNNKKDWDNSVFFLLLIFYTYLSREYSCRLKKHMIKLLGFTLL